MSRLIMGVLRLFAAALIAGAPLCARAEDEAATEAVDVTEVEVKEQKEMTEQPASRVGSSGAGYRVPAARVGPLGDAALRETPLSLHVTSGELIENRGAHTEAEALKANPAVATLMESNGYSSLSRIQIRGFTAADQNDMRDGLVDRSFTFVPLENVERIEVLNGLSSALYGFAALGGTVNYVTKRPTPAFRASAEAGQYGGGINYLLADLGGPIADGRFGYRVIGYREEGDTAIHFGQQRRTLLAASADWRFMPGATLTGDFWFQSYTVRGLQTYFLPHDDTVPSASRFDPRKQFGQEWTFNDSRKGLAGIQLEVPLLPEVTLRAAIRYGRMWREYLFVAASLDDGGATYSETAKGTPRQTETTQSAYALVDGNLTLAGVRNRVTAGYSGTQYRYTRGKDVTASLGSSTVDSPTGYTQPTLDIGGTTTYQTQALDNLILSDRVALWDGALLHLGVNYAQVRQNAWGQSTGISMSSYVQRRWTPNVGVTVALLPELTVYGSYMEGLVVGGTAPSTAANANAQLSPSVGTQVETGVKATFGQLDVTAALYRIDRVNAYVDPSDNVYKQEGREVHQGIELTATGRILDRLAVTGGASLLRARVTNAEDDPTIEGKIPVNIPEATARLYAEYDLPVVGLTVTGGANYSGRRPITATDSAFMPDAVTFDAGVRYRMAIERSKITLTANVSNLFDTRYWSYFREGDGLSLGSPRVIQVSTRAEF